MAIRLGRPRPVGWHPQSSLDKLPRGGDDMATPTDSNEGRHNPFPGPQGWGMAAFICILTAALYFTAYEIHKATYRDPRLPTTIPANVVGSRDDPKD